MYKNQSKNTLKHWIFISCVNIVLAGHKNQNDPNSDVIITYSGHSDAQVDNSYSPPKVTQPPAATPDNKLPTQDIKQKVQTSAPSIQNAIATESQHGIQNGGDPSVVFLKNEEINRDADDGYLSNSKVKYNNVNGIENDNDETVHEDAQGDTRRVYETRGGPVQTAEPPLDDSVVFVTGRNRPSNEDETFRSRTSDRRNGDLFEVEKPKPKVIRPKINCGRLICDNALAPVCAGKLDDNRQWKYRLFMNMCHLTKVNCGFSYDSNRYIRVPKERCEGVANHHRRSQQIYEPTPSPQARRMFQNRPKEQNFESRLKDSRRSFNLQQDGKLCSHRCPEVCPEDYEPECARTEYGAKKVFMNHCAVDKHSCTFGVLWQIRPLADCVGQEKENVRQNRGFIGWMQKVGIIDGRGKLVLDS